MIIDKNINCAVFINASAKILPSASSRKRDGFAGARSTGQRDKSFLMPIVSSVIKAQLILVSGWAAELFDSGEAVES